jgi:hypothetical protein
VQFWLQTDYLPLTSLPLVDITTDLTPMGKTEDTVYLEAKVTINNRGSVPVYVGCDSDANQRVPLASASWHTD